MLVTNSSDAVSQYSAGVKIYHREHPLVQAICERSVEIISRKTQQVDQIAVPVQEPFNATEMIIEVNEEVDDFREESKKLLEEYKIKSQFPGFK
jgi:hypothetical protein